MDTVDKDTPENKATSRGAGGGLQSKAMTFSDAGDADAPQHPEDEQQSEEPDETTTPDS